MQKYASIVPTVSQFARWMLSSTSLKFLPTNGSSYEEAGSFTKTNLNTVMNRSIQLKTLIRGRVKVFIDSCVIKATDYLANK